MSFISRQDTLLFLVELSFASLHRLKKFGFGEFEVKSIIKYLRGLHDCLFGGFDVPHHTV